MVVQPMEFRLTDAPERRRDPRQRSLLGARIKAGPGGSTTCLVRNIGSQGAKLAISGAVPLPEAFPLTIDKQRETRTVHLVWRTGDFVGVRFTPAPAAAMPVPLHLHRELRAVRAENAELRGRLAASRDA
jgi:hypothetical protein